MEAKTTQTTKTAKSTNPGVFAGVKNATATLVLMFRTRLALLANEVEEEKYRLLRLVLLGFAATFFLLLGVVVFVVFLAAALWEHHLAVLGIASFLFLAGAFFLLYQIGSNKAQPSTLFKASLHELDQDLAVLKQSLQRDAGDGSPEDKANA